MKKIIYRKSDLQCVGTVVDNMTIDQEIKLNVIPNFGGVFDDYDFIETNLKNFHLEIINEIVSVIDNEEMQRQLNLLKPSQEEIEKAEYDIKLINSLTELGVI